MAAVSSFLRFVLPSAPTAAQISAERYIVDSAIEFCEKTGIWREVLDTVNSRAGFAEIELDLPADSQILQITDLYFDGQHIEPLAPDTLDDQGQEWFAKTATLPRGYYSTQPGIVVLVPAPDSASQVRVHAKLLPKRNSTVLPDILLDRYPEIIQYGALKRLLMEPSQAYSDPNKAIVYAQEFEQCVSKVRQEAQKGFTRSRHRTKKYYF